MTITIIIPCFNEEKVIRDTYRRLSAALDNHAALEYELLFVDDGSTDGSHSRAPEPTSTSYERSPSSTGTVIIDGVSNCERRSASGGADKRGLRGRGAPTTR